MIPHQLRLASLIRMANELNLEIVEAQARMEPDIREHTNPRAIGASSRLEDAVYLLKAVTNSLIRAHNVMLTEEDQS